MLFWIEILCLSDTCTSKVRKWDIRLTLCFQPIFIYFFYKSFFLIQSVWCRRVGGVYEGNCALLRTLFLFFRPKCIIARENSKLANIEYILLEMCWNKTFRLIHIQCFPLLILFYLQEADFFFILFTAGNLHCSTSSIIIFFFSFFFETWCTPEQDWNIHFILRDNRVFAGSIHDK